MIKTLDTVEGGRIEVEAFSSLHDLAAEGRDAGFDLAIEVCDRDEGACPVCSDGGVDVENVFAPELLT